MSVYRHIVLFRVFEEVPDDRLIGVIEVLASNVLSPGVVTCNIERSLDERKGRIVIEDMTFVDRAAFDRFRDSPQHVSCSAMMADISDWWIGDYELETSLSKR